MLLVEKQTFLHLRHIFPSRQEDQVDFVRSKNFEHQHSRCANQSLPSALTHFLVFFCVRCVDGAFGPLFFFITADRFPKQLFCHVLFDVFVLSLDNHNGKVVCAGLHWSVIFAVLFVPDKQFIAAPQELCFPALPHVTHEVSQKGRWSASSIPNFQKAGDWRWAETADTQLRRTATVKQGQAIRMFGHAVHPFSADADSSEDVLAAVCFQSNVPFVVKAFRSESHAFWLQLAEQLRAKSLSQLRVAAVLFDFVLIQTQHLHCSVQ